MIGSYIDTKQHNRFGLLLSSNSYQYVIFQYNVLYDIIFTEIDCDFAPKHWVAWACCCNNLFSFNLHFYESEELDVRIRSYLCLVVF